MSDLSDLAYDVTADMPVAVRKVVNTALENGWELNPPGLTVALRLNHPTDEIAAPVYVTWAVTRTPTGRLSFKFFSCSTRTLVPLSGADLLVYLQDPTVAYMTPVDVAESDAKALAEKQEALPSWDSKMGVAPNLGAVMGASLIGGRMTQQDLKPRTPPRPGTRPLKVQAPKANRAS